MALKRWDLVDEQELKLMTLRCFLIGFFWSIVVFLVIFFLMKSFFAAEFSFIGMFIGTIYFSILIYKRDWLDRKIGLFDSYLQGISYQGTVLLLVTLGIALSFIFFAMALVQGGIYSAIAFGLCVSFPIVFMLLRLNVYNNSSRLLYVGKEDGMDCYEQVWGYHPVFYYIFLGIPFGRGPLGLSFKKVLDSIFLHVGSLEYSIIYFIFCLIIGCFILSPDIANKIVPFEIKTFEGTKKFIMISLALIFICLGPLTF